MIHTRRMTITAGEGRDPEMQAALKALGVNPDDVLLDPPVTISYSIIRHNDVPDLTESSIAW